MKNAEIQDDQPQRSPRSQSYIKQNEAFLCVLCMLCGKNSYFFILHS